MWKIEIATREGAVVRYHEVEVETAAHAEAVEAGLAEHQWITDEWDF